MIGIKVLVVLAVTAFHFAVVSWCERSDLLVTDTELCQRFLEEGKGLLIAVAHLIGKFKAIIRLDTLNGIWEFLDDMLEKLRGGIGAVLLKSLQIPKSAVFVNEGVLIELFLCSFSHQTDARNEFHIYLDALTGILHLLIWFWDILGVRQLDGLSVNPAQQLVQSRNGSCAASLP